MKPEYSDEIADSLEQIEHAITVPELSKLLHVHKITLYRMAAAGRIPSFRIATAVRFDPRAVAKWLRTYTLQAPVAPARRVLPLNTPPAAELIKEVKNTTPIKPPDFIPIHRSSEQRVRRQSRALFGLAIVEASKRAGVRTNAHCPTCGQPL